jgi:hypothetical protein
MQGQGLSRNRSSILAMPRGKARSGFSLAPRCSEAGMIPASPALSVQFNYSVNYSGEPESDHPYAKER